MNRFIVTSELQIKLFNCILCMNQTLAGRNLPALILIERKLNLRTLQGDLYGKPIWKIKPWIRLYG